MAKMTPIDAMEQGSLTAMVYAGEAVHNLCKILDIDITKPGWQIALQPYAPIVAAMITAAAQDVHTAARLDRIGDPLYS